MNGAQLLLIAHIAAAIVFTGTSASAASKFPRAAKEKRRDVAESLDATVRSYGTGTIAVPILGFALAQQQGFLGEVWVWMALVLNVIGALLVLEVVLPGQRDALTAVQAGDAPPSAVIGRLHGAVGAANLAWALTLVLMVVKPWM
jgi:uncharacterized membrane protein